MDEWEDWKYLYRTFIFASISEPLRITKDYETWDNKIELFSEISSDSISYEDLKAIIQEIIVLTFNYTHGQSLKAREFLGSFLYYYIYFRDIALIIIMLTD